MLTTSCGQRLQQVDHVRTGACGPSRQRTGTVDRRTGFGEQNLLVQSEMDGQRGTKAGQRADRAAEHLAGAQHREHVVDEFLALRGAARGCAGRRGSARP